MFDSTTHVYISGSSGYLGNSIYRALPEVDTTFKTFRVYRSRTSSTSLPSLSISSQYPHSIACATKRVFIHCAGLAHCSSHLPLAQFITSNSILSRQAYLLAAQHSFDHFIFISSASVYGSHHRARSPLKESDVCRPDTYYGVSKLLAENLLVSSYKSLQVPLTIIRIPAVYGPNSPGNVSALARLLRIIPLVSPHYSANSRSLLYIGNLISALYHVILNTPNDILLTNLSDDRSLSFSELVGLLVKAQQLRRTPLTIGTSFVRPFQSIPFVRKVICDYQLDLSNAKTILKWEPPIPVEHAIHKSYNRDPHVYRNRPS